mgnify:FL=1
MVFEKGSLLSRIRNLMLLNRTKATNAEKTGDRIQVVPISETLCQLTASNERPTTVNPMMAPMIE